MSSDDKDEGGVVLGGISFGLSDTGATAKKTTSASATEGESVTNERVGKPFELGDALLPLRVVVVADLLPRGQFHAGANPPDGPITVSPGELDGLFARLAPRLALEVDSVLDAGKKVRVDLAPSSMKSFRPDSLVREIPLLRSLLDGRRVVEQLKDGTVDLASAQRELSRLWNGGTLVERVVGGVQTRAPSGTKAPEPAPAAEEDVARILDMVDTGTTADAAPSPTREVPVTHEPARKNEGRKEGRFDAFLAAVAGAGKRPGANPAEALRVLDRALSVQLGAILQHPELRRLEEAWRGVHFLLRRTPKTSVRVEVVSAQPDSMAPALERAIHGRGEVPVSFAVIDDAFGSDAASLERLRALAEVGEAHALPVMSNATSEIFGHPDLEAVDRIDNKQSLFDAPERVAWRSEANRPAMLWVALGLNRILARSAYDSRSSRVREAQLEELPADEDQAAVWMQPCYAIASLAMQSFEKTGWPCRITGARDGGVVEDLPVREKQLSGTSERAAIPTEAFFSTETQKALSRLGLLAFASQPNSDAVYLLTAPTAYVPPPKRTQDYDTAEPEVRYPQTPLVDQLFVARLAQFLRALGSRIAPTEAPGDVEEFLEAALWELFSTAKPGTLELTVEVSTTNSGLSVSVTVRPRRFLGVSMEEITLGVPLA